MIVTTTNTIEGKNIKEYLGIVSGVTYTSTFSAAGLSIKDIFKSKKYYEAYEEALNTAKASAFDKLKANAENLKANAIVGINLDIESISESMMTMISVVGTAVLIE
jgi:uncharacterized protein YbjQ (UPF0145 family)